MDPVTLNTGAAESGQSAAPEGHDAAMAAKVDETNAKLEQTGQEAPKAPQEKLLGKFDSAEDLAKAYAELEKKLGAPKEEAPKAEDLTEDAADELIEKAGLDVDSMASHYDENGSLSDEHYAALEKAGIPRQFVDQYISGVEAEAAQMRDNLMNEVGGQEAFGQMSEWAVANLPEADLAAYNAAVDSGDESTVRSAVMSLAYRYQREAGRDPKLVGGGNGGGAAYQSLAQLTAAMKDPRYESDHAYRQEVQEKLGRSNIF